MTSNADILVNAIQAKEWHEEWWADNGLRQETIDNVAVLFSDEAEEEHFISYAQKCGWKVFNSSEDHVVGHLNQEDYDVRFTFLRDPDDPNFRIETMLLNPEQSTIHRMLLRQYGEGAIAQGSYKPQGINSRAAYQEENGFLLSAYGDVVECFQSKYGLYTYFARFRSVMEDLSCGYLKVRLNERDR
jgi:hypothetical protein